MRKRCFLDIDILGPTCQLSLGQERSEIGEKMTLCFYLFRPSLLNERGCLPKCAQTLTEIHSDQI